eukprot:COSAG03_NODE_411_length_8142_cov_5.225289_11_plen_73_part_00
MTVLQLLAGLFLAVAATGSHVNIATNQQDAQEAEGTDPQRENSVFGLSPSIIPPCDPFIRNFNTERSWTPNA